MAALLALASPAAAQVPLPSLPPPPGRLFTLGGEASTVGELYGISGREPRRPGAMARLLFQPQVQLTRYLKLSLDLQLSSEESSAGATSTSAN